MLGLNFGKQFSKPEKPTQNFQVTRMPTHTRWSSGAPGVGKGGQERGGMQRYRAEWDRFFCGAWGCGMAMRVGVESLLDNDFFFIFFFLYLANQVYLISWRCS